jgi:DNA-binding response OmpR family regulator
MKVLIIDDDRDLLDLLRYGLESAGYEVSDASDGEEGLQVFRSVQPDIVLLDVGLPGMDGFAVCRSIRDSSTTPIIMFSGRPRETDMLRALRLGAEDYLIKPFRLRELRARMDAVLHRSTGDLVPPLSGEVHVGDLVLDPQTSTAVAHETSIQLTGLEFRLLHTLAANLDRVVPYSRLFEYGWGREVEMGGSDAVPINAHIVRIREKLRLLKSEPLRIASGRGIGYALTARKS